MSVAGVSDGDMGAHSRRGNAVEYAARRMVDTCRYRNIMAEMARAAAASDVFNAIGETHRREILDALVAGERPVGELVDVLRLTQPQVSKHLRVLSDVGLVRCRAEGRRRLYRLDHRTPAPCPRLDGEVRTVLEQAARPTGRLPRRPPAKGRNAMTDHTTWLGHGRVPERPLRPWSHGSSTHLPSSSSTC